MAIPSLQESSPGMRNQETSAQESWWCMEGPAWTHMPRGGQSDWRNWGSSYLLATCTATAWPGIANGSWQELRNCGTTLPSCASGHARAWTYWWRIHRSMGGPRQWGTASAGWWPWSWLGAAQT